MRSLITLGLSLVLVSIIGGLFSAFCFTLGGIVVACHMQVGSWVVRQKSKNEISKVLYKLETEHVRGLIQLEDFGAEKEYLQVRKELEEVRIALRELDNL